MPLFKNIFTYYLDVPSTWGLYFQDSATPQMEGLVELHDNIMYYLVIILFGCRMNIIIYNKKLYL